MSIMDQRDSTNLYVLIKEKHNSTNQFLFSPLTSADTKPTIKEYLLKGLIKT